MRTVVDFINRHRDNRLALVCHQRPDGDAIGSCIGLAEVLRSLGREVVVANALPLADKLTFLDSSGINRKMDAPDWHKDFDAIGVLDCGALDRLDPVNRQAAQSLPAFTIDHHASSVGIGDAVWIEPEASSTGEMVVRLCEAAGWPLPATAAQALWTAIVTDTGRFSYENTHAAALAAGGACLRAGARPAEVARRIYQSVGAAERLLQARTLARMRLLDNGRLAVSWLADADFREAGIGPEVDLDAVSLLRDTAGVEVAIFLYETASAPDGGKRVKVSMRTAAPHNALDVVTRFGGGGHTRAAGCTLAVPLPDAENLVLKAATDAFFPSIPGEDGR